MLQWLKTWVKNIAVFLIFISLLEMIMPHEKYRKYIKIILGLIFMLVVIEPVIKLINGESKFEVNMYNNNAIIEKESIKSQMEYYTNKQKEIIKENYKDVINEQIITLLNKEDINVEDVRVNFIENSDEKQFGNIKEIFLIISKKNANNSNKMTIKPIKINSIGITKKKEEDIIKDQETILIEKKIKTVLSNFYNLSMDNIYITIQKKYRGEGK